MELGCGGEGGWVHRKQALAGACTQEEGGLLAASMHMRNTERSVT